MHRLAIGIYDDDRRPASWCGCTARNSTSTVRRTEVPALVGVSRGKLILVNDDDLTYCSLRLDAESLQTALQRIADIAEPLPRTLVWSAAWEMTREAELRARDFVALVVGRRARRNRSRGGAAAAAAGPDRAGRPTPTRPGRASRAGRSSPTGCWNWRAARSPDRITSWPSSTRCARRCCRPGTSDVWPTCSTRDPAELGLAGLDVDTDLRWRIVTALADRRRHRRRRARRRRSSTPRCSATRPRPASGTAPRPRRRGRSSDVKEKAWTTVVEDDTLANITARVDHRRHRRARTGRAAQAVHRALLRGDPRSVGAAIQRGRPDGGDRPVPALGHQRRGHRRRRRLPVRPERVPPALRRLVLEGQAGVKRSLRARRFDAVG